VCFVLLHHRTRGDWPLVLLANRDEYFDRPFEAPALRDRGHGIVAPKDLRAGGTWLGVNRHGLLAAVTNRREHAPVEGVRSRGLLVTDALALSGARAAASWAKEHLADTAYAGFNLLLADGRDAFVVRHPGAPSPRPPRRGDVVELAPGSHVLTNLHDLDEVRAPTRGAPAPGEPIEATLDRLALLATDSTTPMPGDHRILKRGSDRGTVASALVAQPRSGPGGRVFRFADGPPDVTPFLPVP
jgi:hypothetical protein